jgi:hypothetical protein
MNTAMLIDTFQKLLRQIMALMRDRKVSLV